MTSGRFRVEVSHEVGPDLIRGRLELTVVRLRIDMSSG